MATISRPPNFADEVSVKLRTLLPRLSETVMDRNGDWTLKGFIDVWTKILPMKSDTKVVSKAFELATTPIIISVMEQENFQIELATKQNSYPDITISDLRTARKVALDLKSTYYLKGNPSKVNGFTLGAFTGYFPKRKEKKNIAYPYETYDAHLVLGVLYDRNDIDATSTSYTLDELHEIPSVAKNIQFLLQPKWRIAMDRPGSGNTKNIGSVLDVDALMNGEGPFTKYPNGKDVFDRYWMNYLTKDMARVIDTHVPYRNLEEYFRHINDMATGI